MLGKADDFKEMAVAIARQGRDAHTRKHFAQTGIDGRVGFIRAAGFEGFGKLICEVRHDGAGASRDQKRDMMSVKDLG